MVLPQIRAHLAAAADQCPLTTAIETFPISEDGLLGYELVPDRDTHTYLILGCNAERRPVLRTTSYGVPRPGAVELIAVDGQLLSRGERATRYHVEPRDYLLQTLAEGAELAVTRLAALFPASGRTSYALSEKLQGFEQALGVAYYRLARWDPCIYFFGVPNEAELGFGLTGADGEEGALALQRPDLWTLTWNASPEAIRETWTFSVDSTVRRDAGAHTRSRDRRKRNRRASDGG